MKPSVKGGLAIGILCAVWTYIMGFTGWYRDPAMTSLFWVVVLIEVGVLIWALRLVPEAQRSYGALLKQGVLMSLIGGIIVFFASLLFTTVFFPEYFAELQAIEAEGLRAQGMTAEQIEQMQAVTSMMQSPVPNAVLGFLGTFVTGTLASLLIAIFLRKKTP